MMKTKLFKDKSAIIACSSQGIDKAIAIEKSNHSANIILYGINQESTEKIVFGLNYRFGSKYK